MKGQKPSIIFLKNKNHSNEKRKKITASGVIAAAVSFSSFPLQHEVQIPMVKKWKSNKNITHFIIWNSKLTLRERKQYIPQLVPYTWW